MNADKIFEVMKKSEFKEEHDKLNWTGTFREYLDMLAQDPMIARSAFQRTYDMIESYGYETYIEYKKEITHWKFWDDPIDNGKDAIFGLDVHLQKLVNTIKSWCISLWTRKKGYSSSWASWII